jgi:hypothetical protein
MPAKMPMGVVIAKRTASVGLRRGRRLWGLLALSSPPGWVDEGREAMRIPRERPSKSWWKMIAATRDATWKGEQLTMRRGDDKPAY